MHFSHVPDQRSPLMNQSSSKREKYIGLSWAREQIAGSGKGSDMIWLRFNPIYVL
jgi:hypothetical protein